MDGQQPTAGGEPESHGEPTPVTMLGTAASKAEQPKKKRRPALLDRFPKLFWRPKVDEDWPNDWNVLEDKDGAEYEHLADDLAVWNDRVKPTFRRLDHNAQVLQNQFWRQNLGLIAGGLVATSLGAIQAVEGGGIVGIAVTQAVLTGLLTGLTVHIRSRRAQRGYLTARLKAERTKSEFFLFLARSGEYARADRQTALLQQVHEIEIADGAA